MHINNYNKSPIFFYKKNPISNLFKRNDKRGESKIEKCYSYGHNFLGKNAHTPSINLLLKN